MTVMGRGAGVGVAFAQGSDSVLPSVSAPRLLQWEAPRAPDGFKTKLNRALGDESSNMLTGTTRKPGECVSVGSTDLYLTYRYTARGTLNLPAGLPGEAPFLPA